jgi:large conductance mechanosensitive channel
LHGHVTVMTGAAPGAKNYAVGSAERRCSADRGRRVDAMINESKVFLFRGNVVDLAVAVVIGTAFTAIVTSLVADIITPLLGILGIPDFSTWTITVGDAEMRIGVFLNALISFVIIAAVIFFGVIKPMNRLMPQKGEAPTGPSEVDLLTEIRDELRKSA